MAVNKYGNDFRNNIMWNKEYPFIPEITNDNGLTIHEGDILETYNEYSKKYEAVRVYKIYDKDIIWTRLFSPEHIIVSQEFKANEFLPHIHLKLKVPKCEIDDFDNQGFSNELEWFLSSCYAQKFSTELSLPDDWHIDIEKCNAKRLEEVAKLKCKY